MNARTPPGKPAGGDLADTLQEVAATLDVVAAAVMTHDRSRLDAANERARTLLATLAAQVGQLEQAPPPLPDDGRIAGLVRNLRSTARRNTLLIERAWAVDAATTRLLLSLGRGTADATGRAYATAPVVSIERNA